MADVLGEDDRRDGSWRKRRGDILDESALVGDGDRMEVGMAIGFVEDFGESGDSLGIAESDDTFDHEDRRVGGRSRPEGRGDTTEDVEEAIDQCKIVSVVTDALEEPGSVANTCSCHLIATVIYLSHLLKIVSGLRGVKIGILDDERRAGIKEDTVKVDGMFEEFINFGTTAAKIATLLF